MKKIILCFLIALISLSIPHQVDAQKLILKNGDEQFAKVLKTTDSDYHYIDSFTVQKNEAGIVETTVIGFDTSGVKAITGVIKVRYVAANSTITLGTTITDVTLVTDSGLSPGTFNYTSSGAKVYIRVKGALSTAVHWYSTVKRKAIYKSK